MNNKTPLYKVKDLGFTTKLEDMENIMSVHEDSEFDLLRPNMNETIYFDLDPSMFIAYRLDHPLHWPTISYRLYGTVRLAWLLMKINNVKTEDCFKRVRPGEVILAIGSDSIQTVVNRILELAR